MKYKILSALGVCSILLGYGLAKSGARVLRVACERTENAFLPVCHVNEYFLGLPNGSAKKVGEITQLANYGKEKRQFFLLQRLNGNKLAPIPLNKVRADHPSNQEPVTSLNRLAGFFQEPNDQKVDVYLSNEAGSLPWGIVFFVLGVIAILASRKNAANRA